MKYMFIIAALSAAAAFSHAATQGPANGTQNPSCDPTACPQDGSGSQGQCRGQRQDGQRRGMRGQGQGQGQGQGKGQGQGRGQRGNCGSNGAMLGSAGLAPGTLASTAPLTIPAADLQPYLAALQSTLEKELYARDYYTAADNALSGPPRFGNLAIAEQRHANMVGRLITYLGGTPVYSHNIPFVIPSTVTEADDTCREIELLVIRVYDRLIAGCPDPLLLPTLNHIQASNYQHLSVVGG